MRLIRALFIGTADATIRFCRRTVFGFALTLFSFSTEFSFPGLNTEGNGRSINVPRS
jgi:hypothetical protein